VTMNSSPIGRPEGGWVLLLAGRRSQLGTREIHKVHPRAGPSRGTWSSAYLPDGISPRKVRDEGKVLSLLGSHTSTCFFTPFVRELEDLQLRQHGEYCKSCRSQWHRSGAEWHERAIQPDERLQIGK